MDQQPTPPSPRLPDSMGFTNIELLKEQTLGIGSYGKVCRARCDHLLCAAKIIHETLFDPTAMQQMPQGHEHRHPIRRFEQESEFLKTIRHPNVIQYLGMCQDPDTGLPVLLMELMDESLTHFLETATQSIPYHIQANLCHDISLALTFLHANGIIHRDLSSNNVLLISNVRAKVTDFGMAKLGDMNPRMSRLTFTMCPGTDVYMPPEAVQDQPVYTEKIDCFSFGVIIIQVLTHQFPKPGDRMQKVEINHPGLPRGTVMICIPETDRRQNHISQIDPNNTLLLIALDCLKDRDNERPSAEQLCERIAALKDSSMYADSIRAVQIATQGNMQEVVQSLREQHSREIQHLQESRTREQQLLREEHAREIQQLQESQAREQQSLREEHVREMQHLQEQAREQQSLREEHLQCLQESQARELESLKTKYTGEIQNLKEIHLREKEEIVVAKEHEIQHLLRSRNEAITAKERETQQQRTQLEQTTHRMNEKEQTIEELERQLKQMQLHLPSKDQAHLARKGGPQECGNLADLKLAWSKGKIAPKVLSIGRWCNAAVNNNLVYFNVCSQTVVYCYNTISELWTCIPNCPNKCSSFIVLNNMLTAIGGINYGYSNKVYSLNDIGGGWMEMFPPMPTRRASTTAICTETSLIIVGGKLEGSIPCPVEVMNINTHQWFIAADVPCIIGLRRASGALCYSNNQLYILGAFNSKLVYSCSLSDLFQTCQLASEVNTATPCQFNIWKKLANLPLYDSTCLCFCGHLLAIGGSKSVDVSSISTRAVYTYKSTTNSWEEASQMSMARRLCFAVTLPNNNELMVVGGKDGDDVNSVEFANCNR